LCWRGIEVLEEIMSRTLAGLAALAIVATPAAAAGYGFDATYAGASVPTVGSIDVVMNPEVIRETHSYSTQRMGVTYIAPRDAEKLVAELKEELEAGLAKAGAYATASAPTATLTVTIESAMPSNPAHTQNGRNANLDFRSAARGGATLVAELVAADGSKLADFTYRWEESSFDLESSPRIGWYGAERAFDRFAARLATDLAAHLNAQPAT
jgi:hypothetical protein